MLLPHCRLLWPLVGVVALCFLHVPALGFLTSPNRSLPRLFWSKARVVSCRRRSLGGVDVSHQNRRRVWTAIVDDLGNNNSDEEDEDEEEEAEEDDLYAQNAISEFVDDHDDSSSSLTKSASPTTTVDWGGALGKLRDRVSDIESGASQNPSNALFRLMVSQTPNQVIGSFIQSANPQVVGAMSGAVNSLLGGLSNPMMGTETIVKANGEKIGSLCFQLQMTGYMFRNAEYVVALKDIMNIRGSATLEDYKDAFDSLDTDNSGYIEVGEIEALLKTAYKDSSKGPPAFEIKSFLDFFDTDNDGVISWEEFERGLGDASSNRAADAISVGALLPAIDEDDEEYEGTLHVSPNVSGVIEIELNDGEVIEVEASEYIDNLKREAQELKETLRRENGMVSPQSNGMTMPPSSQDMAGGLVEYISSRKGDVKSLTESIRPEVVETMKRLVDFVLEGGPANEKIDSKIPKDKIEMEIPSSALQQLALWQLVLGYRLREAEATGDYYKIMEN